MAKTEKSKDQLGTKPAKAEVVQPLKVEINFPSIMDLKQALAFDNEMNLIIAVQFKARVDQYEIFRLVNLLKQPHGTLFAIIGSPQSAMDFKFDTKAEKVEVIKAAKALPQGPAKIADQSQEVAAEAPVTEPKAVKIFAVTFNHIPEEEDPFGVCIDYVGKDGFGEIITVAGRGKNPTEAVMSGVLKFLPDAVKEPFEAMAALELLDPSPECYKLIRAIEVGSFPLGDVAAAQPNQGKEGNKGE